ncbi:MAG: helix-turn-helix domain-containing protein [Solirubrobacteraceae bacterium]
MSESEETEQSLLALGRAVHAMREKRRISRVALASASGIDLERIDALEAGRLDLPFDLLFPLAYALDTQPSELIALAERLMDGEAP